MSNKVYVGIIISLLVFGMFQCQKATHYAQRSATQESTLEALSDTLAYTQDKYGREVASKRVIVAEAEDLKKANDRLLSENQRLLKKAVTESKPRVITATQIREKVVVRVDTVYQPGDSISLENEKTILFTEDRKTVRVQVTNSNPDFKSLEVDAYYQKPKPKWHQRRGFKIALLITGFVAGVSLAK